MKDFNSLLKERTEKLRAAKSGWAAADAQALVAGVLLAREDVPTERRAILAIIEIGIDHLWNERDMAGLKEQTAFWFKEAGLEQQAYVVPVLNELEQAWIDGRLELTPAVAPEEPKEDVTEPMQTELFTAPEPVKADPGKKLWESLFGRKST